MISWPLVPAIVPRLTLLALQFLTLAALPLLQTSTNDTVGQFQNVQEQDLIGPSVPSHEPIIVGRQIELLAAIKNGLRNISSSRTIFPRETNPRIVPKNHNSLSKYKDSYSDTGDETGDTTSSDGDYTDYTEYGGDYTDYTEYGGEYTEYGGDYTYSDSSETESNSTYNTDFPLTYTFVENTVDYFYTSIPDDRFTEFATTTEEVKKLRDGMDFIDLFIDEIGLPPEVLRILAERISVRQRVIMKISVKETKE